MMFAGNGVNASGKHCRLLQLLLLCLATTSSNGFLHQLSSIPQTQLPTLVVLHSTSPGKKGTAPSSRRKILLSRNGPHFEIDKGAGTIEFGATIKLTTKLDSEPNPEIIAEWLADERALALSIWDEKLMTEIRDSVYQLQTMSLQFVTIQLAPSVDMKMQTRYVQNDPTKPVFLLQSVGFDPNIQLLPGISMSAEDLGIEIEVSGELRPTKDGTGVSGKIAFQTSGLLPPPLRILPQGALKAATNGINEIIVNQATKSFEKGATEKYREFKKTRQQ